VNRAPFPCAARLRQQVRFYLTVMRKGISSGGGKGIRRRHKRYWPLSAKPERLEALEEICVQFGVVALYAFGSQAREVSRWLMGQPLDLASNRSYVDIGVKPTRGG